MSDRLITDLHPALIIKAQKFIILTAHIEDGAFITETYRSRDDQEADWRVGRDAQGNIVGTIITNAHYGQSPHNVTLSDGITPASCAFDFAIRLGENELDWDASDRSWREAINIGEDLGLISGSTFHSPKDSPHLELPNWRSYIAM